LPPTADETRPSSAARARQAARTGTRMRRAVPAGMLDAGLAALATFSGTSYATRFLSPADLGTYALFLIAFLMAAAVSSQLLFSPTEIVSLRYEGVRRLRLLEKSLRLGFVPVLGAAIVAVLAAVLASAGAPGDVVVVVALALTSGACALVSPLQDHVRRVLHAAGYSWRAAMMSVTLLGTVLACLLLLHRLGIRPTWVPIGALFLANAVSLVVGWYWSAAGTTSKHSSGSGSASSSVWAAGSCWSPHPDCRRVRGGGARDPPLQCHHPRVRAGRAGAEPAGQRADGGTLGRPWPQLMQAGAERRGDLARRVSRPFRLLLVAAAASYLLAVGFPWPLNPLPNLLPSAYVVAGLLPVMIIGQMFQSMVQPSRAELTGAGQGRTLLRLELASSAFLCIGSTTAGMTGPFAMPVGAIAQGVVGLYPLGRARRPLYVKAPIPAQSRFS
jgi:O-antigen/teichoic acid export membrane protein